jgi:hypothetical protein
MHVHRIIYFDWSLFYLTNEWHFKGFVIVRYVPVSLAITYTNTICHCIAINIFISVCLLTYLYILLEYTWASKEVVITSELYICIYRRYDFVVKFYTNVYENNTKQWENKPSKHEYSRIEV